MKKILFLLAVLPMFLVGCSDDDEDLSKSLKGTVWETVEKHGIETTILTINFGKTDFLMKVYDENDNNMNGKIEKDEITRTESTGSYTYEYPNAVLTLAGEKEYMTVSGNKMTSKPDADGEITVLTKK